MDKYIISNYRGSAKEQFIMKIISETTFMNEKAYICELAEFSPYKDIIITKEPIRDSLIGNKDNLYSWYKNKEKHFEQLSLF